VVEKPATADAPSNLAISGRYVFCPAIFDALAITQPSVNGEIQLTDGINHLLQKGHRVLAYKIDGQRLDIGTPEGWLHANMVIHAMAKNH
jgi:UTP--glucose-1-phosphate uridylyltransferase